MHVNTSLLNYTNKLYYNNEANSIPFDLNGIEFFEFSDLNNVEVTSYFVQTSIESSLLPIFRYSIKIAIFFVFPKNTFVFFRKIDYYFKVKTS